MATINGYTAEHMDTIKDATIDGASIVSGNLIFSRYGLADLNVGNVIGPQGPTGATGSQGPSGTGLVVCTSTTRPASPSIGQNIYETDTGKHLVYYGATTLWRQPWNKPWGQTGYGTSIVDTAISTSAQTSIGLATAGMTLFANRLYEVNWSASILAAGAALQTLTFELWNVSTKVVGLQSASVSSTSYYSVSGVAYVNVAASTPTWTVRALASGGGGTITNKGTVTPSWITVKDIGPSTSTPPGS